MKVTPMAQGQGLAPVSTTPSPDRLANARAIAEGRSPIRQTPSDTPVDPQVARLQNNLKKIKMRTQVSPDRLPAEPLEVGGNDAAQQPPAASTDPIAAAQSVIPETNVQAESTDETRPLSPQFAALAKQRRALQQERAAFEQEKTKHATETPPAEGSIALADLKADPLSFLESAGVTYEMLTEAILGQQSNPAYREIKALKAEIEALKSGVDTKFTERDTQAEEQVVSEMKREAESLVFSSEDYKYTRAMKKAPEAARLVHEHWKETGEIWSVDHALTLIEAECKKDYEALTSALTPQEQREQAQRQQETPPSQGMRTLTNRDTARPAQSRRDRMIAAFNGTLKQRS